MASAIHWYKQWVKAHPSLVAYLESGLSSMTYLLPDRFADSDFNYELLNACLGLAAVWHTSILKEDDPDLKQPACVLWLAALQQIETLVEIRAIHLEQHGKLNRYGPLAVVELAKALLRLRIQHVQCARLLVNDTLQDDTSMEVKHERAATQRFQDMQAAFHRFLSRHLQAPPITPTPTSAGPHSCPTPTTTPVLHPAPLAPSEPASPSSPSPSTPNPAPPSQPPTLWWSQPPPPPAAPPSPRSLAPHPTHHPPRPSPLAALLPTPHARAAALLALGELLHTHRPLLYVLLLKRHSRTSWVPWTASLLADLASLRLIASASATLHALDSTAHPCPTATHLYSLAALRHLTTFHWTLSEEREMTRRKLQLALYLLRSPFFDRVSGRALRRVQLSMRWLPLLGSLGDKLVEIVQGLQQYYTYTSGS